MATIGRFAAGVAHEVGNPLGAILGYMSMLEKDGTGEDSKDYLKRIEKEIERINRIVRELLDFSRPSKGEIRDVEVNRVVENTLSLLSYQKNFRNIDTQLELDPELPGVRGDESQLSQVFLNIILNAIDAMPAGGTLGIRTEDLPVENPFEDPFLEVQFPETQRRPGRIRLLSSAKTESSVRDAHEIFKRGAIGEGSDLRHRDRDKKGGPRKNFRSLLYDQTPGQGDRPGVVDLSQDRRVHGRGHEGGKRSRKEVRLSRFIFRPNVVPR